MLTSNLRIATVGLMAFLAPRTCQAQWVNPPTQQQQDNTPGLVHETYESPLMRTAVGYSVVLPPSYGSGQDRYPVVYWLHGGGGNESSSLFTSQAWRDLYEKQQVQEVILVYPSAFRSGYMDHYDGKVMLESLIIQELIPRIDERFRTLATRRGRAVHGFSMGASGALKFAIKYPDLFCSAVAYGGGAIDLEKDKSPFIVDILERNLKSDATRIRENNTYYHLERNHERVVANQISVLMICGEDDSWKKSAVEFQKVLVEKKIPCELRLVDDVAHKLRPLMDAEGRYAALFQDNAFVPAVNSRNQPGVNVAK